MTGYDFETALQLTYAWIKAAHVIFVIFWIAGLFMLPRYYVYHQEATPGSVEEKRWIDREKKLRNIIITPAMAMVWVFGLTLAFMTGAWSQGWFHAKFALVIALSGYHGWMVAYGKKLARGERPVSGKALRIMNEVPGIATAIIVILVIVRPF
ncbi:CopD family protein [Sphingomonas sp. LY54]|uniref:CopD family protein n=1 Tax=Sphingomonadales TaxID=204457 RepID=UPI002ADED74B|nr:MULTISPECIES: CopD family protein [Sphingomonadales]MEA1014259.1 CopD family protein [Sphingosinicella sp. LY1275]WRP27366.1 CopD family protein [Sphingomonas sp. LY54]